MSIQDDIGLSQQIALLEEALAQSNRIRTQWQTASSQLSDSQHALKVSDNLHRQIIKSSFDAIIIADQNGIIQQGNPAAQRIFGYPLESWPGMSITTLIPEYLRQQHQHGFSHYIDHADKQMANQSIESEGLHQDGHTFPIELNLSALNTGEPQIMATIRDISAHKGVLNELEQRVEERTLKLRKLSEAVEQAPEAILITDRTGNIEYVNRSFMDTTGFSMDEVIGQTPRILKSGNQDAAFYQKLWETISSGKAWSSTVVEKRKDGSFYPAMLSIAPIMDHSGKITHFVGYHQDITEQQNMEKQFHQAQKMEAIGTLVGGIAHDFNNMLAGITANLHLAKRRAKEMPELSQKLNNIEQLSFRAADMIQQLLTFARKDRVSMKVMPLRSFLQEALLLLQFSIPENITIKQNICTEELMIKGDSTQIHQALMNLLNNARDAVESMQEPCITINVDTFFADAIWLKKRPDFDIHPYAHISIKDNGCGIPGKQIEHLFEPFFTTKEQGKGTGLGLSMVFGMVKTHHGFIEVDSRKGEGATFHIYIPLTEEPMAAKAEHKTEMTERHGELILLADDETIVRETMAEVLESMGCRVVQAKDGLQAIEIFKTHQQEIKLALLDVVMPHCGGMPLAKQIREMSPHLPLIFLTGYDKEDVLAGDDLLQNCCILSKPVNFEILSSIIRDKLNP